MREEYEVMLTNKNYWTAYIITFILFWCYRVSPIHHRYTFLDWPFMFCFAIIFFLGFMLNKKENKKGKDKDK